MEKLKPCPFCGGEGKTDGFRRVSGGGFVVTAKRESYNKWFVKCVNFCASFHGLDTEKEAINVWNTRKGEPK